MLDSAVTSMFEGFRNSVKQEMAQKVSEKSLDEILLSKVNQTDMTLLLNKITLLEKKVEEFNTDHSGSEDDELGTLYEYSEGEMFMDDDTLEEAGSKDQAKNVE